MLDDWSDLCWTTLREDGVENNRWTKRTTVVYGQAEQTREQTLTYVVFSLTPVFCDLTCFDPGAWLLTS